MLNVTDKYREDALQICKSRLLGIKICFIFVFIIIFIMLITAGFNAGFLLASLVILVCFGIAAIPFLRKELKIRKIVETEPPLLCTAIRLGWERAGKRSLRVAYFLFDGKEQYAIDYREDRDGEVHENDPIYVWRYKKTFLMVKATVSKN